MGDTDREFRWRADRDEEVSLEAIRGFVNDVARDLDPGSRYVAELRGVLEASRDVPDYLARLQNAEELTSFREDGSLASSGERGRSWVDAQTWSDMDPFERTLSNLLTGETRMMWAGEGARNFELLGDVLRSLDAPLDVLSVPCSTGKEPYSVAIAAIRASLEVRVVGVDRQEAYVAKAQSGTLVPHHRDLQLDGVGDCLLDAGNGRVRVSDAVRARCSFQVGDVITGELPQAGGFGLVSCRNLLGYFRGDVLATAWRNVAARVRPGGVLLLDYFVSGSDDMALARKLMRAAGFTRRFPDADYYDAPADWGS